MELTGLTATEEKKLCLVISKGSDIEVILNNGYAATTADDRGAINIWKDDEYNIRCEAMRYCKTVEQKIFYDVSEAIIWADEWIELIK